MPAPFDEDFFQRIQKVHWESEPKVFWMASDGDPYIINGSISKYKPTLYTSDDGKHWNGVSISGPGGFNAIYGGGWMREGLDKKGRPVWVLLGARPDYPNAQVLNLVSAASTYSTDGNNISSRTDHDYRHIMDALTPNGGSVQARSTATGVDPFGDFHDDFHTSTDGRTWVPQKFHPTAGPSSTFAARLSAPRILNVSPSVVATIVSPVPIPDIGQFMAASRTVAPIAASFAAEVMPLAAADTGTQSSLNKVFVQGVSKSAIGKLKKGPLKGKTVKLQINPFDATPPSHGFSSIDIIDTKTGELLGSTDCGIPRTVTIAYGYYVFCVGGATEPSGSGPSNQGMIVYTEDGINWGSTGGLGDMPVNVLAVGPRK